MTNNEAISRIKFLLDVGGSDGFTSADIEALNMAINALYAEIVKSPKSNGDKIRQMTDEELARFLDRTCGCYVCFLDIMTGECASFKSSRDCIANKVKWLKQEVSEDAGTD